MPASSFILKFLLWISEHFHALIIETFRFKEIEHVELHFCPFSCVWDAEIEPLSVSLRIQIILKNKVVLFIWKFMCQLEISTLETAFKN